VTNPVSDMPTTTPIVASPAPASTNPAASDAPTTAPTAATMALPSLEPTATPGTVQPLCPRNGSLDVNAQ
jgi:hypothetical protein